VHVYLGDAQKIERVVEFAVGLCYNVQMDGQFFQIYYKSFMMKKVFEEIVHVHKYFLSLKCQENKKCFFFFFCLQITFKHRIRLEHPRIFHFNRRKTSASTTIT